MAVNNHSLFIKVKSIVAKTMCVDEETITEESTLYNDLGVDSLDAVEIIMSVEKEFNISISDEEADKLDSIQKIVDYLDFKNITVS